MNICLCMHSSHIKINAGGKGPNGFTYYFYELKSSHKFCGEHPQLKVININESTNRHLQDCEGVFIVFLGKMNTQQTGLETPPILTPAKSPKLQGPSTPGGGRLRRKEIEDAGRQVISASFLRRLVDEQEAGWGFLFLFPYQPAHLPIAAAPICFFRKSRWNLWALPWLQWATGYVMGQER